MLFFLSGAGVPKDTIKRKLEEAGLQNDVSSGEAADWMAGDLLQSRVDNTVEKYHGSFALLEKKCIHNNLVVKPAPPIAVVMYFNTLLNERKLDNAVSLAILPHHVGTKHYQFYGSIRSIIDNMLLESTKRISSEPVQTKDVLVQTCSEFMYDEQILY